MAAQRTSFEKLQRDRAKKAKAAAKREKRLDKSPGEDEVEELPPLGDGVELTADELLKRVEDLHRRFEDKKISFEDFEEEKADLMARISVD